MSKNTKHLIVIALIYLVCMTITCTIISSQRQEIKKLQKEANYYKQYCNNLLDRVDGKSDIIWSTTDTKIIREKNRKQVIHVQYGDVYITDRDGFLLVRGPVFTGDDQEERSAAWILRAAEAVTKYMAQKAKEGL